MRQMSDAAEKQIKEKITSKVQRVGPNLRVSFTGSFERGDLKVNLNGPDEEISAAQKVLKEK